MTREIEQQVKAHLDTIVRLARENQIVWKEEPTPKPTAMRAFNGTCKGYTLIVTQANVVNAGVIVEGMAIAIDDIMVVRLPRHIADDMYHKAAAARN